METLKNKLFTVSDVIKIGGILNNRYNYLKNENDISTKENEGKDWDDTFYKISISFSHLEFSIHYPETTEKRDSFEWFSQTLQQNAKKITGITISYNSMFHENSKQRFGGDELNEKCSLTLDVSLSANYSNFDLEFSQNNPAFREISTQINSIINNCPARNDKTLKKKSLYRILPSFAISIIVALLGVGIVYALAKTAVLPESFATYVVENPLVIVAAGLGLTLLLGLILPNPNMSLYNQISIDKKYKSYDTNWQIEHYENDMERFENQVEFAVGKFYGSDKVRLKIQKNFKISTFVFVIGLALYVVLSVIMFLI